MKPDNNIFSFLGKIISTAAKIIPLIFGPKKTATIISKVINKVEEIEEESKSEKELPSGFRKKDVEGID